MAKQTDLIPLFDTLEYCHEQQMPNSFPYPDDYRKASDFIYSYRGSEATFSVYRRELERLLQWCWRIALKSLKDLTRQDIENYIYFCQRPYQEWIGTKTVDRFVDAGGQRVVNPEWRPFVSDKPKQYLLSQSATKAIFAVLSSFYNYLIQENYVTANPVSQMRQKSKFLRKQQGQAPIRRLSELQWSYVLETAEQMAAAEPEKHERTLFMMNGLFGMYLRISELASSARWQPQMGHFFRDMDNNYWFKTVGKGNKERNITVSDAMLAALRRYRKSLGLMELPPPGDSTPLLLKNKGSGPISSTRQIRMIVQDCFDRAIERMKADNLKDEAEQLTAATVHWLRHTGISEDVKHRPREHVRDDAGHGSSAITDRYIDVELRARHASGKKKVIKPQL
jgi:site-specific recombinase XerD